LSSTGKRVEHGQGGGGTQGGHETARKFFVINILTSKPLRLKILQTIFAKPAPVKAFKRG
jgi:hypothetical protein